MNEDERATILQYYLSKVNIGEVDLDRIIKMTNRFTPADLEYLFQQVAQFAFEQELETRHDYRVTTDTIFEIIPKIRPTLTEEVIMEFEKDSIAYCPLLVASLPLSAAMLRLNTVHKIGRLAE